ncbi:MAG: hypothetical protein WDZ45_02030 [Flavobacteriaceae bacterium]
MKNTLIAFSIISLFLASCSKEKDPFLITTDAIGHLTKEMKVKQLDSIFAQDSIVKLEADSNLFSKSEQIEVYEKGGKKLLLLTPKSGQDPESKIAHIQLFDERYKTEKGIHLNSTFKDLKDNYTITSISSTMNSVVISIAETELYVTIDKEKLPEEIRNQFGAKVESKDIPDDATFKFLMVGWEKDNEGN